MGPVIFITGNTKGKQVYLEGKLASMGPVIFITGNLARAAKLRWAN